VSSIYEYKVNEDFYLGEFKKQNWDKRLTDIVMCGICMDTVDPVCHILTSCCSKLWCFYCLIQSLKYKSSCPNCRKIIYKSTLIKVPLITELFENFKISHKGCNYHRNPLQMFCESCGKWICVDCTVNHPMHYLVPIKQKLNELDEEIQIITKKIDEVSAILDKSIDRLKNTYLVRKFLYDEFTHKLISNDHTDITKIAMENLLKANEDITKAKLQYGTLLIKKRALTKGTRVTVDGYFKKLEDIKHASDQLKTTPLQTPTFSPLLSSAQTETEETSISLSFRPPTKGIELF